MVIIYNVKDPDSVSQHHKTKRPRKPTTDSINTELTKTKQTNLNYNTSVQLNTVNPNAQR